MSIGQTLASAREKAGLTVEQVAAATRIRRTLVMDIERDDFASSGGDFYARGHIRTIAQKVGTDPTPLLAEFDAARPEAAPPRATDVFESETAARPERRGPNWTAAMALAVAVVLVYGVVQVVTRDSTTPTDGLSGPGGGATTTSAPAKTSSSPTPTGDGSAVAQAPRTKVTVVVRARDTSWVQATTASGEELFQGLLEDESRTFTDRQRVNLVIGNAGAVTLTVNGTSIGSPGPPGAVARVHFTPQDPAAG
ncbi:MAG TPA: RodZ domain-containing protein [Actinomycetes bacterium]|nr:RodZ domain-containing protein [Actinomycetes bacterium]